MSRAELQRVCRRADRLAVRWHRSFPECDRVELAHLFGSVLTSPVENLRRLVACARFYNSFDSSVKKASPSSR
jgi:hypothetical protein